MSKRLSHAPHIPTLSATKNRDIMLRAKCARDTMQPPHDAHLSAHGIASRNVTGRGVLMVSNKTSSSWGGRGSCMR